MTDRTLRGHWWLPENDQDTQPGTLTITDAGDLSLDLIGGFDLEIRRELESGNGHSVTSITGEERPVPILLGETEAGLVTLLDCSTTRSRKANFLEGAPDFHVLGAQRALIGAHLLAQRDAVFRRAYVRFENLLHFLSQSALSIETKTDGTEQRAMMDVPPPLNVTVNGTRFEAGQQTTRFHFEQQRDSASVLGTAQAVLTITPPAPVSYTGFDDPTKAFMDLLTLASDQASGIIACTLVHEVPRTFRLPDGRTIERDVEVEMVTRQVHTARPDDPPQKAHEWLFTCATKPYAEVVSAWLRVHEQAVAACSALFGLKYVESGYIDTQALMAAVAAEAMHKSLYGDQVTPPHREAAAAAAADLAAATTARQKKVQTNLTAPNFRNRMLNLATRPATPVVASFIASADTWASEMETVRNGLAHEAKHPGDPMDLYKLSRSTTYLLYLVLMNEMGFDEALQRAAVGNKRLA